MCFNVSESALDSSDFAMTQPNGDPKNERTKKSKNSTLDHQQLP